MPYASIEDLPRKIKSNLPIHAQEIYKGTFNNALERYLDESMAFKVAWSAVKKQYEKGPDGAWEKRV